MTRQISRAVARRFLAVRHFLAPPRALPAEPESVLAVVDRLGSLQFDPLEVAGRNHDLVLQARIAGYHRSLADDLLYERRLLFEANNKGLSLLPTRELPWYRITWDRAALGRAAQTLDEQSALAELILTTIERDGPKGSSEFERQPAIDWHWGPTSAVRAVLEALTETGRLGLFRRDGNRRSFDLIERLFPADLLAIAVPEREQLSHKLLSRYRAHGLLGASGSGELWVGLRGASARAELRDDLVARGELVPLAVDGLRGERFVVADELPLLAQAEREVAAEGRGEPVAGADRDPGCSFLAPLDPLLWDRGLLGPLYDFEYRWEVYTPAARRRFGYYVLPVLYGDRLVGRIEPRIDRANRQVRLLALWWERGFEPLETPGFVTALADALASYLAFAGADTLAGPGGAGYRPLLRALGGRLPLRTRARTTSGGRPAGPSRAFRPSPASESRASAGAGRRRGPTRPEAAAR